MTVEVHADDARRQLQNLTEELVRYVPDKPAEVLAAGIQAAGPVVSGAYRDSITAIHATVTIGVPYGPAVEKRHHPIRRATSDPTPIIDAASNQITAIIQRTTT